MPKSTLIHLAAVINETPAAAILDPGSSITHVTEDTYKLKLQITEESSIPIKQVHSPTVTFGTISINFKIGNAVMIVEAHVI